MDSPGADAHSCVMGSVVIFELLLAAAAGWAFWRGWRPSGPEMIPWMIGFAAIAFAALVGALRYGGIDALEPVHRFVSTFAGGAGILLIAASVALRHLVTVPANWKTPVAWALVGAVAAAAVAGVGDVGIAGRAVAILLILGAVLRQWTARPRVAHLLLLAVVFLLVAAYAARPAAELVGLNGLNAYHLLLTVGVVMFGLAIRPTR
ncbi:DUF6962 family protein [Oceanibacterium hippocampi]|uniref:NnrS protein n=1 Tax=Oceanibacterium hippocampi TaxID=745714 RepID=A0A1Y5RYJ0_9PROT|nr:hypothetical protein [Oceanibacterium hippocampi]SLN25888.1 hypothetical protein OCH7691_00784 [Oceanibacterium hippocampi]